MLPRVEHACVQLPAPQKKYLQRIKLQEWGSIKFLYLGVDMDCTFHRVDLEMENSEHQHTAGSDK